MHIRLHKKSKHLCHMPERCFYLVSLFFCYSKRNETKTIIFSIQNSFHQLSLEFIIHLIIVRILIESTFYFINSYLQEPGIGLLVIIIQLDSANLTMLFERKFIFILFIFFPIKCDARLKFGYRLNKTFISALYWFDHDHWWPTLHQ